MVERNKLTALSTACNKAERNLTDQRLLVFLKHFTGHTLLPVIGGAFRTSYFQFFLRFF